MRIVLSSGIIAEPGRRRVIRIESRALTMPGAFHYPLAGLENYESIKILRTFGYHYRRTISKHAVVELIQIDPDAVVPPLLIPPSVLTIEMNGR
jgi:hypothetical protein